MLDLLTRMLNAQIVITLLGMAVSTWLRYGSLIDQGTWERVFLGCIGLFVGGNLLKEGVTAYAQKGAQQ